MRKIKAKQILEAYNQGMSMRSISTTLHASLHSVSDACNVSAK